MIMSEDKRCPEKLTVIIRDISPMFHLQEPCDHRRVTIQLTAEQQLALAMNKDESASVFVLEEYKPF
jgi:hypothetical protein